MASLADMHVRDGSNAEIQFHVKSLMNFKTSGKHKSSKTDFIAKQLYNVIFYFHINVTAGIKQSKIKVLVFVSNLYKKLVKMCFQISTSNCIKCLICTTVYMTFYEKG